MILLDGKKVAEEVYSRIKNEMKSYIGVKPGLAFILVGEDPASIAYVRMKQKQCSLLGFDSYVERLPEDVSELTLIELIHAFNRSPHIHGILVQQPLPKHIHNMNVLYAVDPKKDVDGFHPFNVGKLALEDQSGFIPCTPLGIVTLLSSYYLSLEGKHVVIVGRSQIVGKPLSILLSQKREGLNATVTLCHSGTQNLESLTKQADVLIVAMGRAHFIKAHHIKKGAIVIDVGINRQEGNILIGDVDFEKVAPLCSHITPVPGGIGPMTIALLMANTWESFKKYFSSRESSTNDRKENIDKMG